MSNKIKLKKQNLKFKQFFSQKKIPKYTNHESINQWIYSFFCFFHIERESSQLLFLKVFKFLIVGGIATAISGIIFFLCDTFLRIPVLLSNTIAFCVSVIYNYWASCKYVFVVNKEKSAYRRFFEFLLFALIGYFLSQLLLWIIVDILRWNHMYSWFIATIIVMVFNFITRQIFLEK